MRIRLKIDPHFYNHIFTIGYLKSKIEINSNQAPK